MFWVPGIYIYIYGLGAFSGPPRFGEDGKIVIELYLKINMEG